MLREQPVHRSHLLDVERRTSIPAGLPELHEVQRQRVLAEHEAACRRLAKTILNETIHILDSVTRSPTLSGLSDARELWTKTLAGFHRLAVRYEGHTIEHVLLRTFLSSLTLSSSNEFQNL
jgi:predicted GNAT family N-acyltransferase